MEQSFEYLKVQTAMDSITVGDIGNAYIKANNDNGLEWYISVITTMGLTEIKEFGPLCNSEIVSKFSFNYNIETKEYNENYIGKRISKFLNDSKREITQVIEIDELEFSEKIQLVKRLL